jgi:hypothetical protein
MGTSMRSLSLRILSIAVVVILGLSPQIAVSATHESTRDVDAASYAETFGVSVEEARSRLNDQPLAAQLEAALTAFPWFGGLFIEHKPTWRVVIQSTQPDPAELSALLAASGLADKVSVREVKYSLGGLERLQDDVQTLASDTSVWSFIDISRNRLEVHVSKTSDWDLVINRFGVPPPTDVIYVEADGRRPIQAVVLYGGRGLDDGAGVAQCTSGFSVSKDSDPSTKGVVTAAHCPNTLFFFGVQLPFDAASFGGSHDEQFNRKASYAVDNLIKFDADGDTYEITGIEGRSAQSVGDYVCKYGHYGEYACGLIYSKNAWPAADVPNPDNTFILVQPSSDLADPGDSGGPVFSDHKALGIIHACVSTDPQCDDPSLVDWMIYTAVNYVQNGVGVTVLTQ